MEEAYAKVALAVRSLVSDTEGEVDCAKNQAILRSILQHRPVVLGFALATLARRLREGEAAGQQAAGIPQTGIRLALEVVLGSSYDPSNPNTVAPVVDALGEDNIEALLHGPGEAGPLLTWAPRLCLLHACLASGNAGRRRWSWLPMVADSASSLALQELATKGGSSASGSTIGKAKGRRPSSSAAGVPPINASKEAVGIRNDVEAFSATLMVQVCEELATAGLTGAGSTSRSAFPHGFATENGLSSSSASDLLPGGHAVGSFRLKLQSLRDALLSIAESGGKTAEHLARAADMTAVGGVALDELIIHPESVRRALERGRCGEIFIFAVQASLEGRALVDRTVEAIDREFGDISGRQSPVKLKLALEMCLCGSGLPVERGLLDAVRGDDSELSSRPNAAASRTVGMRPFREAFVPPEARQACALMQGLVEEGVRIRELLLTLLDMLQGREQRRPLGGADAWVEPDDPCWRTGADVVGTVQPALNLRRRSLAGVIRAFVEWLADTPWVWGATEGVEGEDWEGDFVAAALAISVVFPRSASAPISTWTTIELPDSDDSQAGDTSSGAGRVDPMNVLDRLVAGAAAAMGHAEAVGWIDILQRVTAAATSPEALKTYAVACVERSTALGGQAPFMVAGKGKRRFSQVSGKRLWGLLERACVVNGEWLRGDDAPAAVLIRAATTAVTASRKLSQSWMISPGLLGSGPVRAVTDMLTAAKGRVSCTDLLTGLLETPGEEGPALSADLFAVFVAAGAADTTGRTERDGDEGNSLRLQATAWLSRTLSATFSMVNPANRLPADIDSSTVASALALHLTRRVPFEAKPVLRAVVEAAALATAGSGVGASTQRSGKRKQASANGEGTGGLAAVASLLKVARAATRTFLLPLPVPVQLNPSPMLRSEGSELAPRHSLADSDDADKPVAMVEDAEIADGSAASVTAALLLDAFIESPATVRRSIRAAMQQRECDAELEAVQGALREALCTAVAPSEQGSGCIAANRGIRGRGTPKSLSAGLSARKAPACLLAGFLVECGVSGWEEMKAAMIPPPRQLLEAAEGPAKGAAATHDASHIDSRPPLTALRLEVWLRTLLCSAESSQFDASFDIEKSFPDVCRTAQTLARAIVRQVLALINNGQGAAAYPCNAYGPFYSGGGSDSVEQALTDSVNGAIGSVGGRGRGQVYRLGEPLESPRRALAGRLRDSPAAGALFSWVSGVVKAAKQYRQWLPWQSFADELRELLLRSLRQQPIHQVASGDGGAAGGRALAAEAAVFAVCELLLAWEESGEEVITAVFQPTLCSRALSTAVAPVPMDIRPPIWLDTLRCLCEISGWSPLHVKGSAQHDPLALAAAAAIWICGDGPGVGKFAERGTRKAWVRWYGANLGSLIPAGDVSVGNWLILSSASDSRLNGAVTVRTEFGEAARNVQPEEWDDWGRSPLQAAWNFPGAWGSEHEGTSDKAEQDVPPAIVLPLFASWLRVVLRSGPTCSEALLEAYLRRMAREVYLPCQFNGNSSAMAQQWLGALIEAEAAAEGRARKNKARAHDSTVLNDVEVKTEFCSKHGSESETAFARRLAVKAFFREELLRFGSGEASVAPPGGPLTWLWPLESVLAACGKAGSLGGGVLARRRYGSTGPDLPSGDAKCVALNAPPSFIARALCTVPLDLLCGARRFEKDGRQPPLSMTTLRAFATRAVDLTARTLATPAGRHWSVARRLLLGMGLLYHALAKPGRARDDGSRKSIGVVPARTEAAEAAATSTLADGETAAALTAIESLVGTALGLGDEGQGEGQNLSSAQVISGTRSAGAPRRDMLTQACRALRPLETGSCAAADDFAEALRGAGAWRAAVTFFGRRKAAQNHPQGASLVHVARAVSSSPPSPLPLRSPSHPPLSPLVYHPPRVDRQRHDQFSSPGAKPAENMDQPVGGHQADGQSTADRSVSAGGDMVDGRQPCRAGGLEVGVETPPAPSWSTEQQDTPPRQNKMARLSNNPAGEESLSFSPRRVLHMRSSRRLRHGGGSWMQHKQ